MKIVVRFTAKQQAKALPIILRSGPGMVFPDRTYFLDEPTVTRLRALGIKFTEISRESEAPAARGAFSGKRI